MQVSGEVVPAGEGLAALRAVEKTHPTVDLQVGTEALGAAEALGALRASVRPNAQVLLLVPLEVARLAEALAALGAQVRPLTCVRAQVHVELAAHGEALGAVRTCVRLLARVGALVLPQAVQVAEALAAHRARVHRLATPETAVQLEPFDAEESLLALGALLGQLGQLLLLVGAGTIPQRLLALRLLHELGGVVALDVLVQEALGGEGELAVGARVDGGVSGDHGGRCGGTNVSVGAGPDGGQPSPLVLPSFLVPAEPTGLWRQTIRHVVGFIIV